MESVDDANELQSENVQSPAEEQPEVNVRVSGRTILGGKVIYELFPPREMENSPNNMAQSLLALTHMRAPGIIDKLRGKAENITFEIASIESKIHFYAIVPEKLASYFESQITASYPDAGVIVLEGDYLADIRIPNPQVSELVLAAAHYLPLRTYKRDEETDPLSAVLGTLSRAGEQDVLVFQINLGSGGNWQKIGRGVIQRGIPGDEEGQTKPHPFATLIEEKISQGGFEASMRIYSASPDAYRASAGLSNLANSFGGFAVGEGNSLKLKSPGKLGGKRKLLDAFYRRALYPHARHQYLNIDEVATIFHLPDITTSKVRNVSWGGGAFSDPPQNLPVAMLLSEEEKQNVNFFAKTEYRNQEATFGILDGDDRRRHFYIIGKTGTGKSTLIANMAISDIRKGHGVGIIDPHGDLSEILLDYIPSDRINDVMYLDPSTPDRTFRINPLQVLDPDQAEVVASGIVSIFQKLYGYSWGPRLEYILRNTLLTLVRRPGSTFLDIPRILTNKPFRDKIVEDLDDPVLYEFWVKEFNKYNDRLLAEAISPILNKVGQFLSSTKIRNILGSPTSTINLEEAMDTGKVVILNLSQGKLGEDNSALMGALFITSFQLAAMNRVDVPTEQRKDFYLYVDEFQNFATESFIKILSEARKYRLNLILANQYTAQLEEGVQSAIFGNVGSIAAFTVGAADAKSLSEEYGSALEETDLVNLGRFEIAVKLSIENRTTEPFLATTLPLPASINQNRDRVVEQSRERYTKKVEKVEVERERNTSGNQQGNNDWNNRQQQGGSGGGGHGGGKGDNRQGGGGQQPYRPGSSPAPANSPKLYRDSKGNVKIVKAESAGKGSKPRG